MPQCHVAGQVGHRERAALLQALLNLEGQVLKVLLREPGRFDGFFGGERCEKHVKKHISEVIFTLSPGFRQAAGRCSPCEGSRLASAAAPLESPRAPC